MLADVIDLLICPHCRAREIDSELDLDDNQRSVLCDRGHVFDVARQGYVSLLAGDGAATTGDSPEMVSARADFLAGGHFDPIGELVAASVPQDCDAVADIGVGTGHYLASTLDAHPNARGIGIDISKAAARRAARAHPRMGSVVADIWHGLPIASGALSAVTCVFAPRNAAELHRVLGEDAPLVIVTPTARHQRELRVPLGLIGVEEDKARRLTDSLSGRFTSTSDRALEYPMYLTHEDVSTLVGMGPSSRHGDAGARAAAVAALPDPVRVTASVTVSVYRRRAIAAS